MSKDRMGKLPPRYSFVLNAYPSERLSKCPRCNRPTHARKFALIIHLDKWGLFALGKTCVYCSRCELIIVHQHELEHEMAYSFGRIAPEVIGNDYLVLGTLDKKIWKAGLSGSSPEIDEMLKHMADVKEVLTLEVEPGGWYPIDRKKRKSK